MSKGSTQANRKKAVVNKSLPWSATAAGGPIIPRWQTGRQLYLIVRVFVTALHAGSTMHDPTLIDNKSRATHTRLRLPINGKWILQSIIANSAACVLCANS